LSKETSHETSILSGKVFKVEDRVILDAEKVIYNPDHDFYRDFLRPYYVITRDGQYLFASTQPGRMPHRAFYMIPDGYKLGKGQREFNKKIGKKLYEIALKYLRDVQVLILDGILGENEYRVGVRVTISVDNPHSAYIGWMGKLMMFPYEDNVEIRCWNYIIPEGLQGEYAEEIKEIWPEYHPKLPITLYDFTEIDKDIRRVLSLGIDYFGGALKKPNLTMVWHRAEGDGLISYHAGMTKSRILKGLSGTGKTTLTVGPDIEQDDAALGKPIYDKNGKITDVRLIGLEAASFCKSEGLTEKSPEWVGLMKSREVDKEGNRPIVLCLNIDCEGVDYVYKRIGKYVVKVPEPIPGQKVGSLQCTKYEKSGTTNGRFIFRYSELNKEWSSKEPKYLRAEGLCFKRFDILEPIIRIIDPVMAVALDSACETVITSAIMGQKVGKRVRIYAATDFMAREQSQQAILKLKVYSDMGLGFNGKLVFFVVNTGYVGQYDLDGKVIPKKDEKGEPIPARDPETGEILRDKETGEVIYEGQGEKITIEDSKKLIHLVENKLVKNWIRHPVFGYLIPDPRELEEVHGMTNFRKRFNLLRYYTPEEIIKFIKRDIEERTRFLEELFKGQEGEDQLRDVIYVWKRCKIPSSNEIREFYEEYYGFVE